MNHVTTGGNWLFEIKVVRAIKCNKYGDAYSAAATINIVDGEAHVEGLISKDELSAIDNIELERYIKELGFSYYVYSRYKNGKKRIIRKAIV